MMGGLAIRRDGKPGRLPRALDGAYDGGSTLIWGADVMSSLRLVLASSLMLAVAGTARGDDPIVGSWKGTYRQDDSEPSAMQLTFVSPTGGISRYPDSPCGGMLSGAPRDDRYEYTETITWGTEGELESFCIGGDVVITVEGDVMKFEWSTIHNGSQTKSVGELKRQSTRKKR